MYLTIKKGTYLLQHCRCFWVILMTILGWQFSYSQQNLFNVPSSDITEKGKLFFQQQINLYRNSLQSNTTLSYGLGKQYEIGVNLLGVGYAYGDGFIFQDHETPYSPGVAINAQKKFLFNQQFGLGIGTQVATNRVFEMDLYIYANATYEHEPTHTKLILGLYYASDGAFGSQTRNWTQDPIFKTIGLQAGIEQNIWKERLFFQMDYISGSHGLGQVSPGLAFFMTNNWVLSAGYGIPTGSGAEQQLILELTYVPKSGKPQQHGITPTKAHLHNDQNDIN